MRILIASDHAGFGLKERLLPFIKELGLEVEDLGTHEFDESDDYPDFVTPLAQEVAKHPHDTRGIIIGGSGQGEAMLANRFRGVRAAVYYGGAHTMANGEEQSVIKETREDNDSNVLSLGARFLSDEEAKEAVREWLTTEFPGLERHKRRIAEIDHLHTT